MPMLNQIMCGDCTDLIRDLPSASVNLVITSPPYYHQRDYGGGIGSESTIEAYIATLIDVMRECLPVLHPTGSIVFNLGDKYEDSSLLLVPYRFAIEATKQLPLTLVNAITWVKRNPTPRQFKRRLVSSTEPFFHFVKSDEYYYDIDAFLRADEDEKPSNGGGVNLGRTYYDLIEQSSLSTAQKDHARAALDEVIQEVRDGRIAGFRMKIRGIHSEPFGGQAGGRQIQMTKNGFTVIRLHGNPMKRDVIEMAVESLKGRNHPAMYPVELVKEFLYLLTRKGDTVLDPFMGSGSTAVACKLTGRNYIGFDLNPDYCRAAEERLANVPQLKFSSLWH
ncbi:MAG: site-specific DNA-methyltransferase [Chloroflexota bacterium]|nr:site-specific DNA-methyltransferase [Chloroflexota bacterium]